MTRGLNLAGVAEEQGNDLWARAADQHRRQALRVSASQAAAARALHTSAERTLREIEHRVNRPLEPQGHPLRLPRGGPRLAERFLWAASVYLRMSLGAVVLVLDGAYLGPVISGQPRRATDLHFLFGEGPAIDAGVSGDFVEVRDYSQMAWRWPAYAPAALDAGFRSGYCIPLAHPEKPGLVLVFAGREPIPYTLPRYEELTRVTRTAQTLLIDHPGTITAQTIQRRIEKSVDERAAVYQASGMLSERLSIDCESALELLRLQAWAEGRPLPDVAAELVTHPAEP